MSTSSAADQSRESGETYLSRHSFEEKLEAAITDVLRERPNDPVKAVGELLVLASTKFEALHQQKRGAPALKSLFAKAMCLPHSRQHSFCNTVLDAVHTDHKLESVGAKSTVALITRLGEKSKREAAARDLERFAANLRFVPFAAFKANGCVPRFGAAPDFKHPLSKRGNDNLCIPLHKFDREKTAFIFVSHRWLTPRPGAAGHPDDVDTHCKHELICEAVARLKGPNSPIPENFKVALWMDFSCVNQDGALTSWMEELMAPLIGVCDLLLTPVADSDHASWKLPISFNNAFEDYQAPAWREYWRRAWCRVEAFLAAVVPVESYQERARLFRGGMNVALSAGRRPQVHGAPSQRRASQRRTCVAAGAAAEAAAESARPHPRPKPRLDRWPARAPHRRSSSATRRLPRTGRRCFCRRW